MKYCQKKPENVEYDRGFALIIYKLLDKNFLATRANKSATYTGTGISSENQQLAQELHKPLIKKFKKYKVYPKFEFGDHVRISNIKIFLQKVTLKIVQKGFL